MSRSKRTTLVTGGAGFIGSHLVEFLLARGDDVIVIDDLSTGSRTNLAHLDPSRLTIIEAKVTNGLADLASRFSTKGAVDEIYHLAAAVGVRLVIDEPIRTIETNVLETSEILRFATEHGAKILIASTSEVYGKSPKQVFSEEDDVVYGPTTYARWAYACSKAIDEYLTLAHVREHGLAAVIVRFFNTVGPRQVGAYGMVLPRFIAAAVAGRPIEVHGDGQQSRCFCDVRDVVPALAQLLTEPQCAGRVFNVGSDEPITILELAELVKRTLHSDSQIKLISYEQAFADTEGHRNPGFEDLRMRQPDLSRIREAIDYRTKISLEQTILDIAAHINNTDISPAHVGGKECVRR